MMENTLTRDDIVAMFPELTQITDSDLRGKCIQVLLEAYVTGGWSKDNVRQCPVSLRVKSARMKSQIDHVRAVCIIALSIYDTLETTYQNDTGLRDMILAGALLHDAGKMLEFQLYDGVAGYAPNADLIRHPLSGAILAAKHGLPDEMIHLIANHSFEGEKSKKTIASTIVKMADDAAFSYTLFLDEMISEKENLQ